MQFQRIIFFTFVTFQLCSSAKILGVFPLASKSHHILGSTLLKALAKRGHEVTMISPFPFDKPVKNYRDIKTTYSTESATGIVYIF